MKRSSGWGRLQSYMLNELQPLYDRLGFEASREKRLKITWTLILILDPDP